MKKNKAATDETVRKLIELGRAHFNNRGFAGSSLEEIVQEAQLTRGALYHHFGSKKGLFRAVLESVQQEIAGHVELEASKSDDVWEQLYLGCRAFIAAAVEPRTRRILLIDGPAVLGWDDWRMMDEQNSMRLLSGQLQLMMQAGVLRPGISVDAMTRVLSGALNEAALWIAQTSDHQQSLEETMKVVSLLLDGLKQKEGWQISAEP